MVFAWFSPKVEKRTSAIEGTGLFANADIAAGELVVMKGGHVMDRAERDRVAKTLGPSEFRSTRTSSSALRRQVSEVTR